MKPTGQNIVAYVRVSSDKQGTRRQRESISSFAIREGFPISQWFEDSEGRNPRDQAHKRRAFQFLLKEVQAGRIDAIVVDSQDRFGSKDAYEWGRFIDLLRDNGCELWDSTGKHLSGDDDVSVLTGTLGAITSRREQKEKASRNVSGKVVKAALGEYQGGYPSYGFDVVCFGPDDKEKWRTLYVGQYSRWKVYPDGRREKFDGKDNSPRKDPQDKLFLRPSIEKDRIEYAKLIFKWYATEAISPQQIAQRLNELNVSPVFGEAWHKITVRQMLKNPAYIGLPAWNKRGAGRFVEYVGGRVQDVEKSRGKVKLGRPRDASDYIQPKDHLYPPLVDLVTWNQVQAKLADSSAQQRAITKRSADTSELWLKPFLVCGHCGKPMRATRGGKGQRIWPSYFCGTYGTYGKGNPTGCRCHRVRHENLEAAVMQYIEQTAPKVAKMLNALDSDDATALQRLVSELDAVETESSDKWCEVCGFIAGYEDLANVADEVSNAKTIEEQYGLIYERVVPQIEAKLTEKEKLLDQMLDQFLQLDSSLKDKANAKMAALKWEIDRLREDLSDLRHPMSDCRQELEARKAALENARKELRRERAGRRKTEALSGVIDRITCHFRHTDKYGQPTKKKSFLERVEFTAASGEAAIVTQGIKLGPS